MPLKRKFSLFLFLTWFLVPPLEAATVSIGVINPTGTQYRYTITGSSTAITAVTINAGDSLTWDTTNTTIHPLYLNNPTGPVTTCPITAPNGFSFTFTTAGTYWFHCGNHATGCTLTSCAQTGCGGMACTVIVNAALPTSTPSNTATKTATSTPTGTATTTPTFTVTNSPTLTDTPTSTGTPTFTPTHSASPTPSGTATSSPPATPSRTFTTSATGTPTGTDTGTATLTPSGTPSASASMTPTATR